MGRFRDAGKEDVFAYQAMVGVNYKICEKTYAGLEYKFFAPGKHAYDHDLQLLLV